MDKELFQKIYNTIDEKENFEDFEYEDNGDRYGFKSIGDEDWEDDGSGKYQYKDELVQLIKFGEGCKFVEKFNFFVSRTISRSGSYYTDWYYDYMDMKPLISKEVLIPEQIIPAHTEIKYEVLV